MTDEAQTVAPGGRVFMHGRFVGITEPPRPGWTVWGLEAAAVPQLVGTNHRPTGRGFLMHYRSGSDVLIQDAFRLSNLST